MQWIRYAGVSRKLFRPLCSLPGLGRGFFLVRGRRGTETAGRIGTELTDSRRLVEQAVPYENWRSVRFLGSLMPETAAIVGKPRSRFFSPSF